MVHQITLSFPVATVCSLFFKKRSRISLVHLLANSNISLSAGHRQWYLSVCEKVILRVHITSKPDYKVCLEILETVAGS